MDYKENNVRQYTKYYAGKLYEEIVKGATTTKKHYIYVQGKMMGMYIDNQSGADEGYYLHTDYLGSITSISNQSGTVVERYAYDAWGRRVNPGNWNQPDTRTNLIMDRGYTGHEHLDAFELINMNGRVYDPAVAMFISADPVIKDPGDPLNYNRYSYVLNNPFKYTDPSGYIPMPKYPTNPDIASEGGGAGSGMSEDFGFGKAMYQVMLIMNNGYMGSGLSAFSGGSGSGTNGGAGSGGGSSTVTFGKNYREVLNSKHGGYWTPEGGWQKYTSKINAIETAERYHGAEIEKSLAILSIRQTFENAGYSVFTQSDNGTVGFVAYKDGKASGAIHWWTNSSLKKETASSAGGEINSTNTGTPGWVQTTGKVAAASGPTNQVKQQLFNLASKTGSGKPANQLKYIKGVRNLGTAGTIVGMGVASINIVTDIQAGNQVNGWDVADLGVGTVGLVLSAVLVANPVGLLVVGTVSTVYFTSRLIHDISND